jgi:hypothetical protein
MMSGTTRLTRMTILSWAVIAFDIVLIFLVADKPITSANLAWLLIALAWLFLSLGAAIAFLTIYHRRRFTDWRIWLVLLIMFVGGATVTLGIVRIATASFALLGSMLFLFVGLSLLIALCIRLYHRDIGPVLIAWLTLIIVWSAVIAWRWQGNLIELSFQSMEYPNQPSPVSWLSLLFSSACCLVPLALLSFLWHTLVLLRREMRGTAAVHHVSIDRSAEG